MSTAARFRPAGHLRSRPTLLLALLAAGLVGSAAAATPTPAKTLTGHSSADTQRARSGLLKQRTQSLGGSKHSGAKTVGSAKNAPGKTIVGHAKTSS